ncbi:hypothetical protein D3C86_1953180 [compost metagenome]
MAAGSEPWFGSVKPKLPIYSPEASLGRYCFFCSSLPNVKMGYMTNDDCTEAADRMAESPASSSCIIIP